MADYYSLLSRAIANLPKTSPPSARKAIYDRARKALNNQLRSLKPPLPESDIQREEVALEAAVQRLEAEIDPEAAALQTVAPPAAPAAPAPTSPPQPAPPPRAAPAASAPARAARPPAAPPKREPPAVAPPVTASPPLEAEPTGSFAPPVSARAPVPDATHRAPPAVEPIAETKSEAPPVAAPMAAETVHAAEAPPLKPAAPVTPREPDGVRPAAPRAGESAPGRGLWKWAIVAVLAGLIAAIALGAYMLRSKGPADLAIKEPKVTAPAPSASPTPGLKIAERVGDGAPPSSETPAPAATPGATGATTFTLPPASPAASPAPAPSPGSTPAAQNPPAAQAGLAHGPVAPTPGVGGDRAAMLLAAPQDVQKPAVYVGAVNWSSPPPAPGQGGGPGIRADVDIPDLKMHATMLIRKNVDPGLPASHTIDLRLAFDDGAPFKGLKDVGVLQMRNDEPPSVSPLLGVRVVISDTYFLVGLNRADADMQRNLEAIGSSAWFDFPMLLPDGRIGKLTFEKGQDGDKIVAAALAAWK